MLSICSSMIGYDASSIALFLASFGLFAAVSRAELGSFSIRGIAFGRMGLWL
jgi:hypothetical protein